MSETVLHRDETGKTVIDNQTVKVPQGRSAVSVLGHNTSQDGDDFREDGWVYGPDGQKRRKWFVPIGRDFDVRFWEPKCKDLPTLEAKRWKWYNRSRRRTTPIWEEALALVKKTGECKGWVRTSPTTEGWIILGISNRGGVYWNWESHLEEKKKVPINQKVVDAWFAYDKLSNTAWCRSGLFSRAFKQAVEKRYWETMVKARDNGQPLLHLIINGRHYWFELARSKWADTITEKLAFPEDTHVITETL